MALTEGGLIDGERRLSSSQSSSRLADTFAEGACFGGSGWGVFTEGEGALVGGFSEGLVVRVEVRVVASEDNGAILTTTLTSAT